MDGCVSASDGSTPGKPSPVLVEKLIDVDSDELHEGGTSTPTNEPSHVISTPPTIDTAHHTETLVLEAGYGDKPALSPEKPDTLMGILSTIEEVPQSSDDNISTETKQCTKCNKLELELTRLTAANSELEQMLTASKAKLQSNKEELEREVRRRVELEQRFTEEAKRTTDQIEELISKSDSDDVRLNELRKKFELYARESSSMIENFTTNREVLTSQLLELRQENDYLLGKYLAKSRDLQSADIDLPQNMEELQFHCLTLYEKLILSTMAKERLEEAMMQTTDQTTTVAQTLMSPSQATPTSHP